MWCVQVVNVDGGEAVGQAKRFAHRWQAVRYGLHCGNVPPGYELAVWEVDPLPGKRVRDCGCKVCGECLSARDRFGDALEARGSGQ
jgi:hypothetical protein